MFTRPRRTDAEGNRRRHSDHREPRWKRRLKKACKKKALSIVQFAGLQRRIWIPIPQFPILNLSLSFKPNKHHSHRVTRPGLKGSCHHEHASRQELDDASRHGQPHASSSNSLGSLKSKSSHHKERPHLPYPTRLSKNNERSHDAQAYGYSDRLTNGQSDSSDSYDTDVSEDESGAETDYDENLGVINPSGSGGRYNSYNGYDGYDTDSSADESGAETDDNENLNVVTPSDSNHNDHVHSTNTGSDQDDSYDTNTSEGDSGPDTDSDNDPDAVNSSDSEEEFTTSLHNHLPTLQVVPKTGLGHMPTNPNGGSVKDHRDASGSLHVTLDIDSSGTTTDSDEEEYDDFSSSASDSDEDHEENIRQLATHPPQVAKVGFGDIFPNANENQDNPFRSKSFDSNEDSDAGSIRKAVSQSSQAATVHLGDTHSGSNESQDEDTATESDDSSTDASSEDETEDDTYHSRDEGHASLSPKPGPEKLRAPSIIPEFVPSHPQEDVVGSGGSEIEAITSHGTSATEAPDPQPQPSTSAELLLTFLPGAIVQKISKEDPHPQVVIESYRERDGTEMVTVFPCTSRPQKKKFRDQYGNPHKKKHYFYIGGGRGGKFVTDRIPKPITPELDVLGPKMPKQTYIKLGQYEHLPAKDVRMFGNQQRHLSPSSLAELRKAHQLYGCKKSPPGSVPAAQPEILM